MFKVQAGATPDLLHDKKPRGLTCVCAHYPVLVSVCRVGDVRTADGLEDRLTWMLTSCTLLAQTCLTGTGKTLCANW